MVPVSSTDEVPDYSERSAFSLDRRVVAQADNRIKRPQIPNMYIYSSGKPNTKIGRLSKERIG